jgi:hypothetical protein
MLAEVLPAFGADGLTLSARDGGVSGRRTISVSSTGIANLAGLQFNVVWPSDGAKLGTVRLGAGATGLGALLEQSFIVDTSSLGFFWFDPNLVGRGLPAGVVLFEFDLDANLVTTGKVPVTIESVVASSPEAVIDLSGASMQVDFGGGAILPPTVTLKVGTTPSGGWMAPASVPLEALVDGQGNTVKKVQFVVDGQVVGEDSTTPYGLIWSNSGAGNKAVVARVVYGAGETVETVPIQVMIEAPAPTVMLLVGTVPVGGWVAPASVPLEAVVNSAGNSILAVQFLADGEVIGEAAAVPYLLTWTGVGVGSRTIVARVVFGSGKTLNSMGVPVTVSAGGGGGQPALTLAVTQHASVAGKRTISVASTGLSNIAGLQFNVVWLTDTLTLGAIRVGPGGTALGVTMEQSFIMDPSGLGFFWFDPNLVGRNVAVGTVLFEFDIEPKPTITGKVPIIIESVVASSPDSVIGLAGAAAQVDVGGVATLLPVVKLVVGTAPAGGWMSPASVPLEAQVDAQGNTITKVQFLADGQIVGEDASAPYNLTWANVASGTKSVVARVLYGSNQSADSSALGVTVGVASRKVSGKVEYYLSTQGGVRGVSLNITEGGGRSAVSAADGSYTIDAPDTGAVTLTPSYATDTPIANGVTTADITLIRRHVLGLTLLDSPYKVMAGDVNGSDSVTTADITLIRRLILGTATTFSGGLWRFVPSDEAFANTAKPWTATRMRQYASLASGTLSGQDFKAIKLGDVNGSWKAPTVTTGSMIKSKTKGRLTVGKVRAEAGKTVNIPVSLAGVDQLGSAQMTLSWDASVASYEGVEGLSLGGLSPENLGLARVNDGELGLSWDHPSGRVVDLTGTTGLFQLKLRPKATTAKRIEIRVTEGPTRLELTDGDTEVMATVDPGWFEIGAPGEVVGDSVSMRFVGLNSDGRMELEARGPEGMKLNLEASDTLKTWAEVQSVTGQGPDSPVKVTLQSDPNIQAKFWRLRVR